MVLKDRILFITTVEFRPPFNGGTMYSNCIYEALSSQYSVDVIVLKEKRYWTLGWIHNLATMFKALISALPVNVIYHSGCHQRSEYDLGVYRHIVLDHVESTLWLQDYQCRNFVIAHNIEAKLVKDKLENPLLRIIFDLQKRLERYEEACFSNATGIVCISETEQDYVDECGGNTVALLPAFEAGQGCYQASLTPRFGFIGPASWKPNLRTVHALTKNVFPFVDKPFEFVLAGKGWEKEPILFPRLYRNLGYVKNISDFWNSIDVLIAPTQQGAGVNVKICEALHYGVPVITNEKSARAIFGDRSFPPNLFIMNSDQDISCLLNKLKFPISRKPCLEFAKFKLESKLFEFLENSP